MAAVTAPVRTGSRMLGSPRECSCCPLGTLHRCQKPLARLQNTIERSCSATTSMRAAQPAPCLPGSAAHLLARPPGAPLRWRRPSRPAVQLPRVTARSGGRRQDRSAAAAVQPPEPPPVTTPPEPADSSSGWHTFWTAVDTSAWLGTVGTAVAFILTQEAMLAAAPVVLPLLALYASRQRERLSAVAAQQAQMRRLEQLLLELQVEMADEVAAEVGAEVRELLLQLQQQRGAGGGSPSPEVAKLLRGLDAKLSAMEGSVVGAGSATRDMLQRSAEQQGQLASNVMSRLQDLGTVLRRDVNGALQAAGEVEQGALSRLDGRMASLEGAIVGLQAAQSDGLMRLNSGLQAAVADAAGVLQEAVREEAYRSLDPLRRLPELVQAALPVTPEVVLSPLERALPAVNEEILRQVIGDALGGATREILEQQAALLEELAGQPQAIAPQQWNQLGSRLAFLQEQMADFAALQAAATSAMVAAGGEGGEDGRAAGGGVVAAPATNAEVAALAAELAGLRSDLGSLTSKVQQLLQSQQQQQSGSLTGGGGGTAAASSLPVGMLAGVAAAVQAVQDQVMLLRQDLEEGDSRCASVVALEQQLEVALAAMFEALASEGSAAVSLGALPAAGSGSSAVLPTASGSAAAAALEQQQGALSTALESLAALGGQLDGMSAQLAALQAGMAAGAAAPAAAAVPALPAPSSQDEQRRRRWQRQEEPEGGDAAAEDGREAAYHRMQELLQQQSVQRLEGGSGEGDNGGTMFAEWLSGHRENAVAAAVATRVGSAAASSNGCGGSGGVQQQIEFAAAISMPMGGAEPPEALLAAVPASLGDAVAAAAAAAPYDAAYGGGQLAASWQSEAPARAAADVYEQQLEQQQQKQVLELQKAPPSAEQLYELGVQRLREGRSLAATPGNALLSHGRLKKQMLDALGAAAAPADAAQTAAVAAARQRLAGEAEELLLLAGRQYKALLEAEPGQAKAFINWGRVIGLRADMARTTGDLVDGGRLFGLAADKFDAALDLEPQNRQALRLGGQAVLDAALCMLDSDPREARALLKDATTYLEAALGLDMQDAESAAALERCRQQLSTIREQRQAQT